MRLRQTRHFGGAASRIDRAPHDDEIAWCEGILCFGHQGRGNDRGRCRLADGQHGDAGADAADAAMQHVDIIFKAEATVAQGYFARVLPIGHIDFMGDR